MVQLNQLKTVERPPYANISRRSTLPAAPQAFRALGFIHQQRPKTAPAEQGRDVCPHTIPGVREAQPMPKLPMTMAIMAAVNNRLKSMWRTNKLRGTSAILDRIKLCYPPQDSTRARC